MIMQQQLKERLLGATAIIAIIVIFVPMILTGPIDSEPVMQNNIPERPVVEHYSKLMPLKNEPDQTTKVKFSEIPHNTELESENDILPLKVEPNLSMLSEQKIAITSPNVSIQEQHDKKIGLSAWVIQLGSFSSKTNADNLNMDLKKAGFTAFVDSLKKDGKTSYRVRVGPEILRADADRLLQEIGTKMKLKGIIVNYP